LYYSAYENDIPDWNGIGVGNRMICETNRPKRFYNEFKNDQRQFYDWESANTYCYELIVPENRIDKMHQIMKFDFDAFFNIKSSVELRQVECLVLKRVAAKSNPVTKGGDPVWEARDEDIFIQNKPFSMFVNTLNSGRKISIINDTNLKNIDLTISTNAFYNLDQMKRELSKYGVLLVPERRTLKVLVLKDLE
jgi:hypothetical protein